VQLAGTVNVVLPELAKVCDPDEQVVVLTMVVWSLALAVGTVAVTPPPVTPARLVTLPGALLATLTASAMVL